MGEYSQKVPLPSIIPAGKAEMLTSRRWQLTKQGNFMTNKMASNAIPAHGGIFT